MFFFHESFVWIDILLMGWFISCLMVRFFKASRVSFPALKQTWLTTARVLFMAMKILDKNFFFLQERIYHRVLLQIKQY